MAFYEFLFYVHSQLCQYLLYVLLTLLVAHGKITKQDSKTIKNSVTSVAVLFKISTGEAAAVNLAARVW